MNDLLFRSSARIATMAAYRAGGEENDSEEEEGQAFYAGGSETRYATMDSEVHWIEYIYQKVNTR